MTNGVAERLYTIFAHDVVLEAEVNQVIEDIEAAEHKATVERIRKAVGAIGPGDPLAYVYDILDVEAAQ